MARRINVNTDELRDSALRIERIAFLIEDITTGLDTVYTELESTSAHMDFLRRTSMLSRGTDDLAYCVHELRGKLLFAASRYEEYDYRMKHADELE